MKFFTYITATNCNGTENHKIP